MIAARPASALPRTLTLRDDGMAAKMAGVLFAALSSAVIWVAMIAFATSLAGITVSVGALALIGSAIAMFLAAVCTPLLLKA